MVGLEDGMPTDPASSRAGSSSESPSPALALDPPLIVADEPTVPRLRAGRRRDPSCASWRPRPRRMVIATHDERLLPLADRVVELTRPDQRISSAGAGR